MKPAYPVNNGTIITYGGHTPVLHPSVFVANGAVIVGDVAMGQGCSVWFNAVIRGDVHRIRIGERTNVQDLAMIHCTFRKYDVEIGSDVTIAHGAILHGCKVMDRTMIGMGAKVLDRAVVGSYSIVAAGAVVREGMEVPEGVLVAGIPARVVRPVTDTERSWLEALSSNYQMYVDFYRDPNYRQDNDKEFL